PIRDPLQRHSGFCTLLLRHPCELPDEFIFIGWIAGSLASRWSRRSRDFDRPASCEQELLNDRLRDSQHTIPTTFRRLRRTEVDDTLDLCESTRHCIFTHPENLSDFRYGQ